MSEKKTPLAFGLILIGALIGALAGTAIVFGNQSIIVLLFGSLAVACVALGSVLALSSALDLTTRPVVEALQDGLQDDFQNLQEGKMTWPIWQAILAFAATIVYIMLLLRYHKFDATWWGWMPVWIPTVLAIGLLSLLVTRTDWFQDQDFETPAWVFLIAVVGFALASFLGITRTEDTRLVNPAYEADSSSYNHYQTNYYFFGGGGGGDTSYASDFDMPECSGKSCEGYGYVVLLIIFIVLVLILIIGSAFIANFWVFAGGLFISIMMVLAIQGLMLRPSRRYRY